MDALEYTWIFLLVSILGCQSALQTSDYELRSSSLPEDVRFRPPIGNGHIATNVLSDTVYMNGLFNGYEDRSSRARIPAYVSVDVTKETDVKREFTLDMYKGLFQQMIEKSSCNINITYFAHRSMPRLLVTLVRMDRKSNATGEITVKLINNRGNASNDFNTVKDVNLPGKFDVSNKMYFHGKTKKPEVNNTEPTELHVLYTSVPPEVVLQSTEETRLFVFVASHSMDRHDALQSFTEALNTKEQLLESHKNAWANVWKEGRIDVSGNKKLSQNIIAATYNIICSLPSQYDEITPFFGLSPGGLSRGGLLVPTMPGGGHNDYAGHVFWDMDTWMMPPITLLHPAMGRRMLSARTRVIGQVKENAKLAGYQGTKFPWEQATTGIEATPKWAGQMSRFEIHINADISYSLRQYLYANDDRDMVMAQRGFELALEIARFWQSRANRTDDNTVEILDNSSGYESSETTENEAFKPSTSRARRTPLKVSQPGNYRQASGNCLKFKNTRMLCEDLKLILDMPEMCDVTFLVGPKEVPVHAVRAILGTRSKVFYQLILQHIQLRARKSCDKRKQSPMGDRLNIPVKKYDSEVFRLLIQFVHCGTVTISPDNVSGLLCGANQFQLDDLEDACWEFIRRCLISGRGETLLKPARLYRHFQIADAILNEIYAVLDTHIQGKTPLESTV